ncbi:MAG: hypothetical protein PHE49_04325 [bacterium]|nr:hypothetical protein [bacterium]
MKKNYFFILSICSMFFMIFTLACNAPKKKPYRYNYTWVDTTWVIPQNDSIVWKRGKIIIQTPQWDEGDTVYVNVSHENGPLSGHISFREYKDSSYAEIKEDTVYNVNWVWIGNNASDTVVLAIVNTSSNDSLQVKVDINRAHWYTDPAVLP